ncbi:MAG: hypothetical protein KF761_04250 [Salinibacterium sp.]|nr:hypothetical protein [Salinibacterium sp.]
MVPVHVDSLVGAPTLEQTRDDFYAVVDSTADLVGGEWENLDSASSRGCVISFGLAGRTYSALRLAPMANEQDTTAPGTTAVLRSVTASWTELGYTVERTRIGPVVQLLARNEANEQLIFRVSDRAMTLQGESACRPAIGQ